MGSRTISTLWGKLRHLTAAMALLSTSAAAVPTITVQPQPQTVTAGQTATFSVSASGGGGSGTPVLKRMMFYYGWLNSFNSATNQWNNENVAQDLKDYDILVLGDGIQVPAHGDYANTQAIITRVKNLNSGIQIFGYVTKAQAITTFQTKATQWNTLGVHGIFLDEAGYEFGAATSSNTRAAFNTRVNYVHGLSSAKVAFANGWNANHILGTVNDASFPNTTHNSSSTASTLNSLDWFLIASHVVNTDSYTTNAGWSDRAGFISRTNLAASLSNQFNVKVAALNVVNAGNATAQAMATAAETGALAGGFDACGISDASYGASSAKGPKYTRVNLTGLGTWVAAPTITINEPWAQGTSSAYYFRVDFTGRTSQITAMGAALTYQWQKNGVSISNATSASYTTPATVLTDNGAGFSVIVSDGTPVTSSAATLTVNPAGSPPTITTHPADRAVTVGEVATFSVQAGGVGASSPPPKRMMFYYGWLSSFNSATNQWNNESVAQDLKDYDLIVLGDGVQTPTHGDFANTQTILARVKVLNPSILIFGYVTKAQAMNTFQSKATQWNTLGVQGIFMDEAGYDYGSSTGSNTRAAFNSRVNYVHGLSNAKVAFANSWEQSHILGTTNDVAFPNSTHNSGNTASTLNASDWFLIESHVINTDAFTGNAGWNDRATFIRRTNEAASLSNQYGLKVASLNIVNAGNANALAMANASEIGALAGNFDGFGVSDALYGAGTGKGPKYARVNLTGLGSWAPAPTVVVNEPWAQGSSDAKFFRVNFTGRTSQIANNGSGSGTALTYQWKRDGANISGANTASYTTPATVASDNGAQFSVVVSNTSASVTSQSATLTVSPDDFTLVLSRLYFGVEGGMGFNWSPATNESSEEFLTLYSGMAGSGQAEVLQLRHHPYGFDGLYFPSGFRFPLRKVTDADDTSIVWSLYGKAGDDGLNYYRSNAVGSSRFQENGNLNSNRVEFRDDYTATDGSTNQNTYLDAGQLFLSSKYSTGSAVEEEITTVSSSMVSTKAVFATAILGTDITGHRVGADTLTGQYVNADTLIADVVMTKKWSIASDFPDYVFEDSYKLKTLEEVEAFTKRNKHLPYLPSAKSMAEKGVDLTEMNLQLLKTVEELTLHVMTMSKEIKRQENEMKLMKDQLKGNVAGKAVAE